MKKTYVKPVMESEEFVANEYVAACWRFTCEGDGTGVYKTDDENYKPTEDIDSGDPFFTFSSKWGVNADTDGVSIQGCTGGFLCGVLGNIVSGALIGKTLHSLTSEPTKTNAS